MVLYVANAIIRTEITIPFVRSSSSTILKICLGLYKTPSNCPMKPGFSFMSQHLNGAYHNVRAYWLDFTLVTMVNTTTSAPNINYKMVDRLMNLPINAR